MAKSCSPTRSGSGLGRWANGEVSGVPRVTPQWRAQSSTSAMASRSVWAAFSADPQGDPGRLSLATQES